MSAHFGEVDPDLAVAGPAGDGAVVLEGGLEARGTERGAFDVFVDGVRIAAGLVVDGGTAVNVVTSPGRLRREWVVGGASLLETVLVAPSLPLLAWRVAGRPGNADGAATLSIRVVPDADEEGAPSEAAPNEGAPNGGTANEGAANEQAPKAERRPNPDGVITVDWPGRPGQVVALASTAFRPADAPGVHRPDTLAIPILPEGVTVLLAAGPPERVRTSLSAGRHLRGHELRAVGRPTEGLRLTTGVDGLDGGVAWARRRLTAEIERAASTPPGPDALTLLVVAALAAGDHGAARGALGALEDAVEPLDVRRVLAAAFHALAADEGDPARRILEVAQNTLGSGDRGLGGPELGGPESGGREPGVTEPGFPQPGFPQAGGWNSRARRAVWHLLADGLRHGASEEEIALLRAVGDRQKAPALRLPMAGAGNLPAGDAPEATPGPPPPLSALIGPLLRGSTSGGALSALAAWAEADSGDPAAAWAAWRSTLDAGLGEGGAGRGLWDDPGAPGTPGAGLTLAALAYGILGWWPDAPSRRVSVRPRLPAGLRALSVEGLASGDARLSWSWERTSRGHRFVLEPTSGRSPVTVVFEPTLPPGRVEGAWVDGSPATLDVTGGEAGVVVPVQLVLDRPRIVEVGVAEGDT